MRDCKRIVIIRATLAPPLIRLSRTFLRFGLSPDQPKSSFAASRLIVERDSRIYNHIHSYAVEQSRDDAARERFHSKDNEIGQ